MYVIVMYLYMYILPIYTIYIYIPHLTATLKWKHVKNLNVFYWFFDKIKKITQLTRTNREIHEFMKSHVIKIWIQIRKKYQLYAFACSSYYFKKIFVRITLSIWISFYITITYNNNINKGFFVDTFNNCL